MGRQKAREILPRPRLIAVNGQRHVVFISLAEQFNIPPKSKQVTFELHVIVKQTLTENVKILQFDVYDNEGKLLDIKSI